jgi:hypothetical protein
LAPASSASRTVRKYSKEGFPMPLSEEERKRLEKLELDLTAEDPRLAHELLSGSVRHSFRTSTSFGAIAGLIGVALLITGISSQIIALGVGGFLLMGAGAYLLLDKQKG